MSASNKAKDKTQAAKGQVKKGVGKARGDRVMEGKGPSQPGKKAT